MAEKLCQLKKKGGGKMSETELWTNPSPNNAFAAQSVTISQALSNFNLIGIKFRSSNTINEYVTNIIKVDEFKTLKNIYSIGHFKAACAIGTVGSGDLTYTRRFYYSDDTHISFMDNYPINNTSGINNTYGIPIQIVGIK